MFKLLDGKKIASNIRENLKIDISRFKEKQKKEIGLAVILVGENPASLVYVRNKIKACEEVGIKSYSYNSVALA